MEGLPVELVERVLAFLGPAATERLRRALPWSHEVAAAIVRRQAAQMIQLKVPFTSIRQCSSALRDDEAVVRSLFGEAQYPSICLDAVSERLRGHRGVMEELIDIDAMVLQHASEELRGDPEVVWRAIRSTRSGGALSATGISLAWLSPALCDREDVARAVLLQKPMVAFLEVGHASRRLRGDAGFMRFAIRLNPSCLQYASEELRGDRDFVLWAVERVLPHHRRMCDHLQLKWLTPALRDDLEVVRAVLVTAEDTASYYFEAASPRLRGDPGLLRELVQRDPRCLHFASFGLRADKELAMLAASTMVRSVWDQLDPLRLASSLRRDPDVRDALARAPVVLRATFLRR